MTRERERERQKKQKKQKTGEKNSGRVGYSRSRIARAHYSLDRRGPRNAGIEFRLIDRAAIKRQSQGRAINKRGLVNIVKRLGAGHGFRGNVDTLFPPSEMDDGNRIIKNGAVHFSNFSPPPSSLFHPSILPRRGLPFFPALTHARIRREPRLCNFFQAPRDPPLCRCFSFPSSFFFFLFSFANANLLSTTRVWKHGYFPLVSIDKDDSLRKTLVWRCRRVLKLVNRSNGLKIFPSQIFLIIFQ